MWIPPSHSEEEIGDQEIQMFKFKIWRGRILQTELTFTKAQNKTVKIQNCCTALTDFTLYYTDDMSFLQLMTSY